MALAIPPQSMERERERETREKIASHTFEYEPYDERFITGADKTAGNC